MRQRLLSFPLAVCMLCLSTMTSCSAADLPTAGSGTSFVDADFETKAPTVVFTDVPQDAWYADGVAYCQAHGVMNGTAAAAFSPEDAMTRAMLAAVLYRMSGSPAVSPSSAFTDAEPGAWYGDAISWASENGLITGYGDGAFGVNDPTTREQAATILWRYAGEPALDRGTAFTDADSIAHWAQPAVCWADTGGILDGMSAGGRFAPKANVKRGEIAAMLYRYSSLHQGTAPLPSAESLVISVGNKDFVVELEENAAARGLAARLPLTVTMDELNSNEKYFYLPEDLPSAPERPGTIQAGDLMLYGSDCLVLFYQSFSSAYSYTRLGRIADPDGLADALGSGAVDVTFEIQA